jgi:hypothetical protein
MNYEKPVRINIQSISYSFLVFWVAFFMIIPSAFGIEENSWKELYLECVEGDCQNGKAR